MSVCDDRACCGGLCACISIVCFAGSLLAHGLLVWEVDPMRDTCEELAYETLAALGANLIVFVLGCLSTGAAVDAWWGQILAGLSALVVILSSRLTLFVHEAEALIGQLGIAFVGAACFTMEAHFSTVMLHGLITDVQPVCTLTAPTFAERLAMAFGGQANGTSSSEST